MLNALIRIILYSAVAVLPLVLVNVTAPVTEANIRDQLLTPYNNMPSFADRLSEEEIDRLIEYLKTL